MVKPQKLGNNVRMSFAKVSETLEMPNLLEIQKKSFQWFLDEGLMEVLRDMSPISDYSGNLYIDFVSFTIDPVAKYPVEECKERDVNYAAPLRVKARLSNRQTKEVKESEIFMGDFPLMTDKGTFVINGAERVIVSQIVRSPGVYFESIMEKYGMIIDYDLVSEGGWRYGITKPEFTPYYMEGSKDSPNCIRTTENVSRLFQDKLCKMWDNDKANGRPPKWTNRQAPEFYKEG